MLILLLEKKMTLFKKLLKDYKGKLEDRVRLGGNPVKDDLTPFLKSILPPIYNANEEVDELRQKLTEKKRMPIEELVSAHEILSPAEEAVPNLIKSDFGFKPYFRAAAKIVDTSDKLDDAVLEEIRNLADDFEKEYSSIENWKPSMSMERIASVREELGELTEGFFSLERAYSTRALSQIDIISEKELFEDYQYKQEKIAEISKEIDTLVSDYQNASSGSQLKSFVNDNIGRLKNKIMKGDLVRACKKTDYVEGLFEIEDLRQEMEEVYTQADTVVSEKKKIESQVAKTENKLQEVKDIQKDTSVEDLKKLRQIEKSLNANKYDDYDILFFEPVVGAYKETNSKLKDKVKRLIRKVIKKFKNSDYWNQKYPISDEIVWVARDGMTYDVRNFIHADDSILKKVVQDNNLDTGSLDEIAYNCMRWVQENINYTSDPQLSAHSEEWLFPTETLQLGKGDCEDGSNLIISLMRNAGMPAYRVKNACGEVIEGGHSWPIYLRELDDEWIILDFSYKPTDKSIEERELAKFRTDYTKMYFTFNDQHSWVQHSVDDYLAMRDRGQVRKKEEKKKEKKIAKLETGIDELNNTVTSLESEKKQLQYKLSNTKTYKKPFILSDELKKLELPLDTRLHIIDDVLQGRIQADGWIAAMQLLNETVESLSNEKDLESTNYLLQVSDKLNEFYSKGYLGKIAKFSDENRQIIESSINNLQDFGQRIYAA